MPEEGRQALERAVRALARRDHSTASLRAKLERAGISDEAQATVLETLTRQGSLDDARFACDRAAQLAGRGYGDEWIRADLERHGVPAGDVGPALASLVPERARAIEQAAKLGGGPRAARSLRRRGFSEDALEGACRRAVAEEP